MQPLKYKKIRNKKEDKFKNNKESKIKALMSIFRVRFGESDINIKDSKNMKFVNIDRYKDNNSISNNNSGSYDSKEKKIGRSNEPRHLNTNNHDSINLVFNNLIQIIPVSENSTADSQHVCTFFYSYSVIRCHTH